MLSRVRHEESGVAMITAMLVSMVVLSLSLVTIQLSTHNSGQSAFDRKRVQAVQAAEAGLDAYLSALPRTPVPSIQCTPSPTSIPIDPGAQFTITATFYPTFPGVTGQEMACPLSASNPPGGAVIVSRGTAVADGSNRAVSRVMQTEVRLNPVFGGVGAAIFSHTGLNLQNNLTVLGNGGNNGDLYTNGSFTCNNSSLDYGSLYIQGSATLGNSCTVIQDLHANGGISLSQSARVGHDAKSSTGSITMANSSQVANNARAATNCTGCAGRVLGEIATNSPSAAPLRLELPTINYVQSAWTAAGYTNIQNFTNCTTANNYIRTTFAAQSANTVVRITGGCALSFANNTTVNMPANLAIISDGPITTVNRGDWQSTTGTPRSLFWIVPRSNFLPAAPPDAAATNCAGQNLSVSNHTIFTNVRTFFYTPCTATFNNNNNGLGGQVFAGTASITNHFTLSYFPTLIPGAGSIVGFNPDIAYIREIAD